MRGGSGLLGAMINPLLSTVHLQRLKPLPAEVYSFPRRGHPDEELVDRVLGGRHWSEFTGNNEALVAFAEEVQPLFPFINIPGYARLFPALLVAGIYFATPDTGRQWSLERFYLTGFSDAVGAMLRGSFFVPEEELIESFVRNYDESGLAEMLLLSRELDDRRWKGPDASRPFRRFLADALVERIARSRDDDGQGALFEEEEEPTTIDWDQVTRRRLAEDEEEDD